MARARAGATGTEELPVCGGEQGELQPCLASLALQKCQPVAGCGEVKRPPSTREAEQEDLCVLEPSLGYNRELHSETLPQKNKANKT